MSEFNFKSAICTSVKQSRRLLSLGLKKETADMRYYALHLSNVDKWYNKEYPEVLYDGEHIRKHDIPAWSLHRIMELINQEDWDTGIVLKDEMYSVDYGYDIKWTDNLYDVLIDAIEFQITTGIFNKEYLV